MSQLRLCFSKICSTLHSAKLHAPYLFLINKKSLFFPHQVKTECMLAGFTIRNICLLRRNWDSYGILHIPSKHQQQIVFSHIMSRYESVIKEEDPLPSSSVSPHLVDLSFFSFGQCHFTVLWRLEARCTSQLSCGIFGQTTTWDSIWQLKCCFKKQNKCEGGKNDKLFKKKHK